MIAMHGFLSGCVNCNAIPRYIVNSDMLRIKYSLVSILSLSLFFKCSPEDLLTDFREKEEREKCERTLTGCLLMRMEPTSFGVRDDTPMS